MSLILPQPDQHSLHTTKSTSSPTSVCSTPTMKVLTGALLPGSSCTLTRTTIPTARGEPSKATSRAPDGWRRKVTVICCEAAPHATYEHRLLRRGYFSWRSCQRLAISHLAEISIMPKGPLRAAGAHAQADRDA